MTTQLIIGIVMVVILALVLSYFKLARLVLLETLRHPLRKTIIRIDRDGQRTKAAKEAKVHQEVPV
jgi:hypothetical protein